MKIGILNLQGGAAKHASMIERLGHTPIFVTNKQHFEQTAAMILPGGESTTMIRLIEREGLEQPLQNYTKPVLGTCAGLILMKAFGWLDITIQRNGWGPQIDSFEADLDGFPGIFIRAPRITSVGKNVEVLKRYKEEPVLVQQGRFIGATFHPELTDDSSIHMIMVKVAQSSSPVPLSSS